MCCSEGGCCKYEGTCIRNLGWALIVLGAVGAILAVIADVVYAGYPFAVMQHISAPIWGGVFIIVAGGLAVCGEKSPDNACLRIALLVMSIIGIILTFVISTIAASGLVFDGNVGCYNPVQDCGGIKALHALQLLLGLIETVVMFIVSIRTCCYLHTYAIIYRPGQPLHQQTLHSGESSCKQNTDQTGDVQSDVPTEGVSVRRQSSGPYQELQPAQYQGLTIPPLPSGGGDEGEYINPQVSLAREDSDPTGNYDAVDDSYLDLQP